jgi:hypothetical protein
VADLGHRGTGSGSGRKRGLRTAGRTLLACLLIGGLAGGWISMRRLPAWQAGASPQLRGVFHVHSDSSHDGRVPAAALLEAAADVGLDFVMFTEHDKQPVHAPRPGGPLVVPGTELSTRYGHLIYFGTAYIPEEGPVRRSVVLTDSLRARGAFTVAAHPGSPKRPWTGRVAGIGGLEIANTSTDARVKGGPRRLGIVAPLLAYPFNRKLALAQLYRRDREVLRRWDRLADPAVVGACGTDTHGWIDPAMNFRTWQLVLAGTPLVATAESVVESVRAGRFVCVAGLLGDVAPRLSFQARTAAATVSMGASVPADSVEAIVVEGPVPTTGRRRAAPPFTIVLLRDGVEVARTEELQLVVADPTPGTYRVEILAALPRLVAGSRQVPVAYSNRIRLTD